MRSSLDGFKQASSNALSKAQLMVGGGGGAVEMSSNPTNNDDDDDNDDEIPTTRTSSFRGLFGGSRSGDEDVSVDNSEQSSNFVSEAADLLCPELTFQQRLIGFAVCFSIAYMITFMSFKFFIQLIEGNPVPFALNYTTGNMLAISASGFLCGPKRQLRNMFDDRRKHVTTVYLSCLASTLIVTFVPLPWALKLAVLVSLLLTQCGANIWYSLSYVPYGRKTALRLGKKFLGIDTGNGGRQGFMGLSSGSSELA